MTNRCATWNLMGEINVFNSIVIYGDSAARWLVLAHAVGLEVLQNLELLLHCLSVDPASN